MDIGKKGSSCESCEDDLCTPFCAYGEACAAAAAAAAAAAMPKFVNWVSFMHLPEAKQSFPNLICIL
eukprot:1140210-Pelagomonas_calceolata.AAC.1